MSHSQIQYSIVIPVFNAQSTLRDLCMQLDNCLATLGESFEIILVDDCSLDDSWKLLKDLAAEYPCIRGFQLLRNSGQGAATMAGLTQSRGRLVVTIDDDLQNPPREVPKLLKYLEDHPEIDAVFGKPKEKQHSLWRRLGSAFINRLSNLMFEQEPEFKLTSFRVIRREVVTPLLRVKMPEPPIGALISTLTTRIVNIEVNHDERRAGRSGYTVSKLLKVSLAKFLGFSTFPLRMLAMLGVIGITLSMVLGTFILFRYLFGDITVQGWTTLALLLIGISGFIFLAFGILGEYLQQILLNTRKNPNFVLRVGTEKDHTIKLPNSQLISTERPPGNES